MLNRNSYILFTLGIFGAITFWLLRSQIDINANAPVAISSAEVQQDISELATDLGFSTDSLTMASMFEQHSKYLTLLQDSVDSDITPSVLNERGAHIQSWVTVIGKPGSINGMVMDINSAFQVAGKLGIRISNQGKVIRLSSNPEQANPTFVQGDSLEAVAQKVVDDIFGYDLSKYSLVKSGITDSLYFVSEGQVQPRTLDTDNGQDVPVIELEWRRNPSADPGPELLSLSLETVVKEFEDDNGFSTRFGYMVDSFVARNEIEPENLSTDLFQDYPIFTYVLLVLAILLAILVIAVGIQNIFKGKVEWRRALFMFIIFALTYFGWRVIYFWDIFGSLIEVEGYFIVILNNVLTGLVIGLYAAMAYISWEAFARNQKNGELELVDAAWQRRFFVRETGSSLLQGFFIGGLLLGLFAFGIYLSDAFFMQSDSQFGFTEASLQAKILTINMTAWSTVWLIGFGQIGFVYGFCRHWISNNGVALIVGAIVSGLLITTLGRLVATPFEIWQDLILFSVLAYILVGVYHHYGIVTVNTAWWVFVTVIMMMPYVGSQSIEMASAWWVQAFLIAGVPLFGFIAYKYGIPVSDVGDYIPEYQERIAQHLRVEKEIEIARESQYKLMPVQPPKAEGIDVYGFFLPSFEVGGDYFDYVLSKDESGTPKALTMTVVDVSGKAMRAAMPAIFTSGLLLSRMKEQTPERILSDVSEPIFTRTDKRTFITCAIAQYDLQTRSMKVANAGHCKPIIKRNGAAEFIETPEPRYPLGINAETKYQSQEFRMKKGDVFLLYSDGLPEAVNEKGERFGFDEVPRLLERINTENLSASEIAQEIKRTVQKFSNYQLADDTTVICLKV